MVEGALVFGVLDLPDAPFAYLEQRWKLVEDLGFDQLWLADQTADFRNPSGAWVDGWIALTVMARHTSRIRIGPLVSNPIMRHPVILAKQVVAVELDRACESLGRDPSTLRRSVLLFEALDPWASPVAFEDIVKRFAEIGFRELVLFWPGDDRRADVEDLARRVIPGLRAEPA